MKKRISAKTMLTNKFPEYRLEEDTLKRLQKVLLSMLKDIDYVCRKYHLTYMLSGGTLLGAIRHKGFIPWDDDIDIMMPREDYIRLNQYMRKEFPDKYLVKDELASITDPTTCKKIYLKDTRYVELLSENRKKPHMIFIDVFSIEDAPNHKMLRVIKGMIFDVSIVGSILKAEYQYPSKSIQEKRKIDKEFDDFIKFRRMLGFIGNLIPMKLLFYIAKKLASKKYPNSKLSCIPMGIRYNREVLPKKVFETIVEVEFESGLFFAPSGYALYLENLYGDYMQIPPQDKREVHIAVEVDFGHYL